MTQAGGAAGPAGSAAAGQPTGGDARMRWPESSYVLSLVNDNKVVSLLLYGAFVLLKVLAVSHWNIATASAILAASSASDLILGALLSALPMALLAVFSFVLFLWLSGHGTRRYSPRRQADDAHLRGWVASRLPVLLTLAVLLPAVVLLPPASPVLACTSVAILLGAAARAVNRSRLDALDTRRIDETAPTTAFGGRLSGRETLIHNWWVLRGNLPTFCCGLVLAAVVVLVGYSQLVSSVWLPHERVTCAGCPHPVVGYVLNANSSELTILVSGSRIVQIVPVESGVRRVVCTIPYSWPMTHITSEQKTVAQLLGLRDDVPRCEQPVR